jgi:hypothetical protein
MPVKVRSRSTDLTPETQSQDAWELLERQPETKSMQYWLPQRKI